jgi:hypothetical protein
LTSARFLTSPCLPFCSKSPVSHSALHWHPRGIETGYTDLPLGETEFHVSTALSSETGAVLERPANRARSDGQVAVVAGKVDNCQRRFATRHRKLDQGVAYVRPADFHAKTILTVVREWRDSNEIEAVGCDAVQSEVRRIGISGHVIHVISHPNSQSCASPTLSCYSHIQYSNSLENHNI